MKFSLLIVSILLTTGCTLMANSNDTDLGENQEQQLISSDKSSLEAVKQALALANQHKDYRLLVTSGRNMSIPGVKPTDYQMAIELCGKKYNPKVGDVITSEEQRLARKKEISFMRQYNEQMLIVCQEIVAK